MTPKVLSYEQVVESGIRIEINRRLLFPAGFSMSLGPGPAPGACAAIFRREAPDKRTPDEYIPDAVRRASAFEAAEFANGPARIAALGYLRQPLTETPETLRLSLPDVDAMAGLVGPAVEQSLAVAWPGAAELFGSVADEVADALAIVLSSVCVVSHDGGATWRLAPAPRPNVVPADVAMMVSRGEHIVLDVERMSGERASELMPGEVEEFHAAAAAFATARDAAVADAAATPGTGLSGADPAALSACVAELERLYALAQPGMRVHRGEPEAFAAWDAKARPALRDAVRDSMARMHDVERLAAGELWPWDDADWPALAERTADDLSAARERAASAERELADALREVESIERQAATVREAMERKRAATDDGAEVST